MRPKKEKYPEGHFVGIYMAVFIAIFSGLGVTISIVTKNHGLIGIGPGMGTAIGAAVGIAVEENYKKQGLIRPLNAKEQKTRKYALIGGVAALTLGVLAVLLLLVLR